MTSIQSGVWLFLDSSSVGGIETHVMQLSQGLASYGVDVTLVLYQAYPDSPIPSLLQQLTETSGTERLTVHILDGHLLSLYRLIRNSQPPVLLHTHGYKAGLIGRFTSRLMGIPVASTWHAGEVPAGIVRAYDFIDRYTAPLAQLRFAVSPQIQSRLPVSSRVMDNFVDMDSTHLSNGQQLAFVGRLSHEKGPDIFLELAQRLTAQPFHMYGGGDMYQELHATAPDNAHLHGMQTDMSTVWEQVGLLIMPSRFEGLPMAVLEAMARGIPVIASNVGALPSVIQHGKNGWLVPAADSDAFTAAIQQWLSLPESDKQAVRLAARDTIQTRFSATAIIPEFVQAYQTIAPDLYRDNQTSALSSSCDDA